MSRHPRAPPVEEAQFSNSTFYLTITLLSVSGLDSFPVPPPLPVAAPLPLWDIIPFLRMVVGGWSGIHVGVVEES